MIKLKILNCDETQNLIYLKNSNCDHTEKFKLWWNSKTQIVMKLKTQIVMTLKTSNCDKTLNSNCNKTQKLKFCQNSKTQIVTKLKLWQKSNCEKKSITQNVTKLKNSNCHKTQKLELWHRTFWHLDNLWDDLWTAFCDSANVFLTVVPGIVELIHKKHHYNFFFKARIIEFILARPWRNRGSLHRHIKKKQLKLTSFL